MAQFIQVPPDSTGKKINTRRFSTIEFISGTTAFAVGDVVTGGTSAAIGEVYEVSGNTSIGTVGVTYYSNSATAFATGEALNVFSGQYAVSDTVSDFSSQTVVQTDPQNPESAQRIDVTGAAYTRFAEGGPQLDAFNNLIVSSPTLVANFVPTWGSFQGNGSTELQANTIGGGEVTYEANSSSNRYSTGTASGDLAQLTTNKYYTYFPASAHTIILTVSSGDIGKANVKREWGYFDDNNGAFFRLDGTQFSVVLRSNVSGSVDETVVNQEDFSPDIVDGSLSTRNNSNLNLDISKHNIYFIDLQWLGAGRVRFGVYLPSGERIVMHQFENANSKSVPYMRTASLPIRVRQENTGTAASGSELLHTCSALFVGLNITEIEKSYRHQISHPVIQKSAVSGETLVCGIRAVANVAGVTNRVASVPTTLSTWADAPVVIKVYEDSTITGGSWATVHTNDALEFNTTATITTANKLVYSEVINDAQKIDLQRMGVFSYVVDCIVRPADGTDGRVYLIAVEPLAGTANVALSHNWVEYA